MFLFVRSYELFPLQIFIFFSARCLSTNSLLQNEQKGLAVYFGCVPLYLSFSFSAGGSSSNSKFTQEAIQNEAAVNKRIYLFPELNSNLNSIGIQVQGPHLYEGPGLAKGFSRLAVVPQFSVLPRAEADPPWRRRLCRSPRGGCPASPVGQAAPCARVRSLGHEGYKPGKVPHLACQRVNEQDRVSLPFNKRCQSQVLINKLFFGVTGHHN